MNISNVKVAELTTIKDIMRVFRQAATEYETINEDLLFSGESPTAEEKERIEYIKQLAHDLRVRAYEIQDPTFSDGIIDLYNDKDYRFTICEHDKSTPIGVIEYNDTQDLVPGNISYEIYKDYQGHNYALRALKLIGHGLLNVGVTGIIVTVDNSTNIPSIKTVEKFGGELIGTKEDQGPIAYTCDLEKIYSDNNVYK